MTAADLADGIDMTSSQRIGMTTTDLTTAEVGLKVILTDKLVRQEQPELFRVIGRQMGDAMARKVDEDLIALFDGFSNTAGSATAQLNYRSFMACVAKLKVQKAPRPYSCVHYPYPIYWLSRDTSKVGSTGGTIPAGFSADLLRDFWSLTLDRVGVYEDGNIPVSSNASKGALLSREALAFIESLTPNVERERDASLRATEVNMISDYGCFELDDDYGLEMHYLSSAPSTSST